MQLILMAEPISLLFPLCLPHTRLGARVRKNNVAENNLPIMVIFRVKNIDPFLD